VLKIVEDKRKFKRMKTHIPVRYFKLRDGSESKGTISVSKNMSEGGIRFRTSEFISMACRLILELDIPLFSSSVKIISRVAWINKSSSQDDFEIGNQFIEMSKEDKKLVSEYIESFDTSEDMQADEFLKDTVSAINEEL